MGLEKYKRKRRFDDTPEPDGKIGKAKAKKIFVIQRHDATRLHYDFRLEAEGVLKSWAVPRGPSLNPSDKRLAVMVEDHPVAYATFEGDIPEGNYGAGHVDVWDKGTYEPVDENGEPVSEREFLKHLEAGSIKFRMYGKKLKGSFALVQMKGRGDQNWLLIKHRDEHATDEVYNSEDHAKASSLRYSEKKAAARKSARPAVKKPAVKNEGSETKTISGKKIKFTNTQKVYFPDDGITKGDIIDYYSNISKYILKYLKDRPESLRRTPNGIRDGGFFHKDVGDEVPEWIDKYKMWSDSAEKEINYIVCNDKPTLLYMANMGCIEINPWNSKVGSPDHPDYLVLDLDPSDKNSFDQVIETAQVIHEILEQAGCGNYCKTSGATGLHIYVPLGAKYDYEQARMFAEMVATLAQEQLPKFTSLERSLKKRGDVIYIDYLQNKSGQTLSSVYSARPKKGATVSTPLEWKEVKPGLSPADFHINNILDRLERKGDLFAPVLKKGIDMEKALLKLGA
jgi:bifunctional non-homologous end joining protein LigD